MYKLGSLVKGFEIEIEWTYGNCVCRERAGVQPTPNPVTHPTPEKTEIDKKAILT